MMNRSLRKNAVSISFFAVGRQMATPVGMFHPLQEIIDFDVSKTAWAS